MEIDFSKIVLTETEKSLFQPFLTTDTNVLTREDYLALSQTGLIKHSLDGHSDWFPEQLPLTGVCEISDVGLQYRAYLKQEEEKQRLIDRRFRITTSISIIALVLSAIAILWQVLERLIGV